MGLHSFPKQHSSLPLCPLHPLSSCDLKHCSVSNSQPLILPFLSYLLTFQTLDPVIQFIVSRWGGNWWKHRYSCHVESFQTQRSHPRFSKRVPAAWDMGTAVGQDRAHTHQLDSKEFGHMFSICHAKYILLQGNNTGGLEASNTMSLLPHGGKIWPSLSHDT